MFMGRAIDNLATIGRMLQMQSSLDQQRRTIALLEQTPAWRRLCELQPAIDLETAAAVLESAGKMSDDVLNPLDAVADHDGCRMEDGRVRVPAAFHEAFRNFAEGGWIGLDLPEHFGGSGLPIALQAAVTQIFDRGCPSFNMGPGASRSGAVLLAEYAPKDIAAKWVPEIIAGKRSTTICISEPGAGSDIARICTRAVETNGTWRVSGHKMWISFGDHDLTALIGHCLLARTSDAPGTRGLSLFLVPTRKPDGSLNGVSTMRLEEKMGLHGSPTCALDFAEAEAILLGERERGLRQLFTMIELMRLQTGCQGLGIASRSADIAESYANERLQGGPPGELAVPIAQHPDVRRQLGLMRGKTEILRAAVLELGCSMDIARLAAGDEANGAHGYAAFLLPLIKNFGAETGFSVANAGIQVLGGAGYTKEWPLERSARDSRVFSIYEGTTGMQALDFLERRLIADRAGFDAFLARASALDGPAGRVIARFSRLGEDLIACENGAARQWAADHWLRAGWLALTAMLAARVRSCDPGAADHAMAQIEERFAVHAAGVRAAVGLADALVGADLRSAE
jgi:hypothetical protein